ncbi:MAG: DUF4394 domain-containing protein [Planctomycetota bacterium]|nr:DUF4394 domain-containing protein [Planctomycetota bacterium]
MTRSSITIILAAASSLGVAHAASAATVVGLTTTNRLVTFDHLAPGVLFTDVPVSGLGQGESLVGIDLRPQTGEVVGVSSSAIYSINPTTGVASRIGTGFSPALDAFEHGIDFNPTVDRIRAVNAGSGNRRLNPVTGGAVLPVDTAMTYAAGGSVRAVGAAYTNSVFGAPVGSTRQFVIDSNLDILGEVGSQAGGNPSFNGGVVTPIGPLGVNTGDLVGFDIFGPTGVALISTTPDTGATSALRLLNLMNGSTQFLGDIAGGTIRDITIVPAPAAAMLLAPAAAGLFRRRR